MSEKQRKTEPNTLASVKQGDGAAVTLVSGYKVTDVTFSESEACPTFMIANINPKFDIGYNLSRMESIVQVAHEVGADILVFPELCISGCVWDVNHKAEVQGQLKASDNHQPEVKRVLDGIKAGLIGSGNGLKVVFFSNVRVDKHHAKIHDSTFVMTPDADYNNIFLSLIHISEPTRPY